MASKAIDQILAITEPNRAASGAAIPAANFDAALAAAVDDQQHAPTPPESETLESAEKHASDTEGSAEVDARGTADKDRPADPEPEQETSEQSEDTVRGEQEQPQDEVELSVALAAYAAEEQKPDTAAQPAVGESGDLQAADDADASAGAESDSRTGVTAARGAQDVEISETQQVSPPVDANETSIEANERSVGAPGEIRADQVESPDLAKGRAVQVSEATAKQPSDQRESHQEDRPLPQEPEATNDLKQEAPRELRDDANQLLRREAPEKQPAVAESKLDEQAQIENIASPKDRSAAPAADASQDLERPAPASLDKPGSPTLTRIAAPKGVHPSGESDSPPPVDRPRFIQRVSGAIEAAQRRDGKIQVRLSPPELGSLRIELVVKQGVLTATLETDNPAARQVLLDNLPGLRARLADQEIRVEQFDVDLRRDGQASHERPDDRQHDRPGPRRQPTTESTAATVSQEEANQSPVSTDPEDNRELLDIRI